MLKSVRHLLIKSVVVATTLIAGTVPAAAQTAPYNRTIIVNAVPGNHAAAGADLLAAVAAANGTSTDRWLIKIEPGYFNIGQTALQMKSWVHIEGSGINNTIIVGSSQDDDSFSRGKGVIQGANNSEIRDLQVVCSTSATLPNCINMANVEASPVVRRVRLTNAGGTVSNALWGVRNSGSSPSLDHVEIFVSGGNNTYGVVNSSFSFTNSRPIIQGSTISAFNASVGNYAIFDREDSFSPQIFDSRLTASGGNVAAMIYHLSNPLGFSSAGYEAEDGSSASAASTSKSLGQSRVRNVEGKATNAATTYLALPNSYTLLVDHSVLTSNGTNAQGIDSANSLVSVRNSTLIARDSWINAYDARAYSTHFQGVGAVQGVTESCFGVSTTLAFYPNTCP